MQGGFFCNFRVNQDKRTHVVFTKKLSTGILFLLKNYPQANILSKIKLNMVVASG